MGKGKVSNVSGNGTLLKNLKAMGILWALILICIIRSYYFPKFSETGEYGQCGALGFFERNYCNGDDICRTDRRR